MKISGFKRLFSTDFDQKDQELVDKLSGVLNIGIETVYEALDKRVSLNDNIDCTVKEVDVTVGADGIPLNTTTFVLDDKTRSVQGLQVIKTDNRTSAGVFPTGGVHITWQQVQSGIQILHVTGLPARNRFTIRVVAYY